MAHISCRIVQWQTVKHHFEQKGLLSSPAITHRELLDIIIISWFLGLHNTKQEYGIAETTALYHLPQRRCLSIWVFWQLREGERCVTLARAIAKETTGSANKLEQENNENVLEHLYLLTKIRRRLSIRHIEHTLRKTADKA